MVVRVAPTLSVAPEERRELEAWSRGCSTAPPAALRAQTVPHADGGRPYPTIVGALSARPNTVGHGGSRFALPGRFESSRFAREDSGLARPGERLRRRSVPPYLLRGVHPLEGELHAGRVLRTVGW